MPGKKKPKVKDLKHELLEQIKQDEKIEKIDLELYTKILPNLEQSRRECVEDIREQNENFQINKKRKCLILPNNDVKSAENVQEVCIENLLLILQYLKRLTNDEKCDKFDLVLENCIKRQNSDYPTYWDSSSNILLALRQCLYKRDWANMSRFLLILLNYGKKYLPIVHNYCRVMVKCWPLIKQSGLENDFIILTNAQINQTIV